MSRLGKIPVNLPKEVKIVLNKEAVQVSGPKGQMSILVPQGISLQQKEDKILVNRSTDNKQAKANHGTIRAILVNSIQGVTQGHKIDLEVQGVGFRGQVQGDKLTLTLGFSHPIEYTIPKGVKVSTPKPTEISVEGIDNALVGEVAANIRRFKPPEPYKGKGIRYVTEVVRRKQGKSVTK